MQFKLGISTIVVLVILLCGQVVFPSLAQETSVPETLVPETPVLDTSSLPETVYQAVLQDLSQQLGVPNLNISVTKFEYATPGWIVVLTDGKETYVYHTDNYGSNVQMEQVDQN